MIQDFEDAEDGLRISADVCIVGAGAAGITLARELSGSGRRICVLESGGFELERKTQDLCKADNVGLTRRPLDETRLRYFGGTTNHWVGQCAPLEEPNFEPHDWVPHSGWPIRLSDVAAYYPRAAAICQLAQTEFGTALWEPIGSPPLAFDPERLESRVLQFGPPARFGPEHREELDRAADVRVLLHANLTNLQSDAAGRRVTRAEFRTLSGRHGTVEAALVVLCCGAIENARLLLLSRDRNEAGLGNRHGLVGRFLLDHTTSRPGDLFFADKSPMGHVYGDHIHDGARYRSLLVISEAARRRERVLGCGIQLREHEVPKGESKGDRSLVFIAEQAPDPESRVTLAPETDALGLQRARIDWRLGELERRTLAVGLQLLAAEVGRLDLGRVRMAPWMEDPGDAWTKHVSDYNHHMGTTRMSDDPSRGVVDRDCRVHGMENLFITGSSVFPTSGQVNPTLTIVALTLRLAEHLKAKWASS